MYTEYVFTLFAVYLCAHSLFLRGVLGYTKENKIFSLVYLSLWSNYHLVCFLGHTFYPSLCVWSATLMGVWYLSTREYTRVSVYSPDSPFHPNELRDALRTYVRGLGLPDYHNEGHGLLAHQRRAFEAWAFELLRTRFPTVRDVGGSRSRWAHPDGDNGWKHVCGPIVDSMDILRNGKASQSPFYNCGQVGSKCPARNRIPAAVFSHSDYYMSVDELSAAVRGPTIFINHPCEDGDEYGVWRYRDLLPVDRRAFTELADAWVRSRRKISTPCQRPARRDADRDGRDQERPITDEERGDYPCRVECRVSRSGGVVSMEPHNGTPYRHHVHNWRSEGCVVGKAGAFSYVTIGSYRDTRIIYAYPYAGTFDSTDEHNLSSTDRPIFQYNGVKIFDHGSTLKIEGDICESVPSYIVRTVAIAHSDAIRDSNHLANLKSSLIQKLQSQKIHIAQIEALCYYTSRQCDKLAITFVQESCIVGGDPYSWGIVNTFLQTALFHIIVRLRSTTAICLLQRVAILFRPMAEVCAPWCFRNVQLVPYVMDECANRVELGFLNKTGSCFLFGRSSNDARVDNGVSNSASKMRGKLDRVDRDKSAKHRTKTVSTDNTPGGDTAIANDPEDPDTYARILAPFVEEQLTHDARQDGVGSGGTGQSPASSGEIPADDRSPDLGRRNEGRDGDGSGGDGEEEYQGEGDCIEFPDDRGYTISPLAVGGNVSVSLILSASPNGVFQLLVGTRVIVFKPRPVLARRLPKDCSRILSSFGVHYRTTWSDSKVKAEFESAADVYFDQQALDAEFTAAQVGENVQGPNSRREDRRRAKASRIRRMGEEVPRGKKRPVTKSKGKGTGTRIFTSSRSKSESVH